MSKSVTSRSRLLPRIKPTTTNNVVKPITIEQANDHRPGAIQQLYQILNYRTQALHQTENKLTNAKALLAYLAVYAIVITIIAIAAIGGVL